MHKYLLPHGFKKFGVIILLISTVLDILYMSGVFDSHPIMVTVHSLFEVPAQNNLTDELLTTITLIGAFLTCLSREIIEDWSITELRLTSLAWAVVIYYLLHLISTWTIMDFKFVQFMIYNQFTIIYIYVIRFNLILYRRSKQASKNNE